MKWIRQRTLEGQLLAGTFLNLGSSLTAEIAGRAGFDWVLIDLEHGAGDRQNLLLQLQALEATSAAPLVRIPWNETPTFKRILDLGPSGIMVPYVSTREEARLAVASMMYPPSGIRGVASFNRACQFGEGFEQYFQKSNDELLSVVQIETREAVKNAAEIAAVERVDVLFVGPLDLSVSLGAPRQFDHPDFREALRHVVSCCKKTRKAAGILAAIPQLVGQYVEEGFTFIGCGSDGSAVTGGLKNFASAFEGFRQI